MPPTPTKLTAQMELIAALEATGLPIKEIQRLSGYTPRRLATLRKAPAYQALVAQERTRFGDVAKFNIVAAVDGIAKKVFDRKVELMEQDTNVNVANAAADAFFDRLYPKKQVKEEDRTLRLAISIEDHRRISDVLGEAGLEAIDVTPDQAEEHVP